MTTAPDSFVDHLSPRARFGWGAAPTARPVTNALYEFGGGFPDPASFPYDGLGGATARVIKAQGAEALPHSEPRGFLRLPGPLCPKDLVRVRPKAVPAKIHLSDHAGQ